MNSDLVSKYAIRIVALLLILVILAICCISFFGLDKGGSSIIMF